MSGQPASSPGTSWPRCSMNPGPRLEKRRSGHRSPSVLRPSAESAREFRRQGPLRIADTWHHFEESSDPNTGGYSIRRCEMLHNVPREACKFRGTLSSDLEPTETLNTDAAIPNQVR